MAKWTRALWLVIAILAVALLPLPGALIRWHGSIPMFGVFPPYAAGAVKPGFKLWVFAAGCLVAALMLAFLLVPRWFGFRRTSAPRCRVRSKPLPWWFWTGLLVNLVSWAMMWWGELPLAAYAFVPLWWGFIVAIDGWVYARTGGRSLMTGGSGRMLALAVVSVPAWGFFEFLNYYALEVWVYPNNSIFSQAGQTLWYLVSFSTVWPAIFEWYTLLHTFDGLWNRWAEGPVLRATPRVVLAGMLGAALILALFGAFPFQLFIALWVAPPVVLTAALSLLGFWTPFRPIRHGHWSPMVLACLAALFNGFFWELWNEGSTVFHPGINNNPNYWYYDIPYVNWPHLFSRMPLLGYFGYLPFGALAWVFWLVIAHILDLDPVLDLTQLQREQRAQASAEARWVTAR